MVEAWVDFAYCIEINGGRGDILVIGPGEAFGFIDEKEYDEKYRGGRAKLLYEIGWEKCFKLGELLQGV